MVLKFNAGFYVRVKKDLVVNETYDKLPFLKEMEKYKNKVYQISDGFYSVLHRRYFLTGIPYEFSEEMLEFPSIEEVKKHFELEKNILNEEIKCIKTKK